MKRVVNKNGRKIDYFASIDYMDDDIRDMLHDKIAPCSEQEFFTAYEDAHEKVFGEEWFLSSNNPQW